MTTRLLPLLLLLTSACAQTVGFHEMDDDWWEKEMAVQALIGGTSLDHDLEFEVESDTEPGSTDETSIGSFPSIGIVGQLPLARRSVDIGFEAGILYSWQNDDVRVRSTSTGAVIVRSNNTFYLTDIFAGVFVSRVMARKVRAYVGAGPMLIFGQYDADIEEDTLDDRHDSDSDTGVGGYVRGGLEYRLTDGSFLGFGVRAFQSDLQFDTDASGHDVSGVQGFLTFTTGF